MIIILSLLLLSAVVAQEPQPRLIQWSPTSYGPDGPWPALRVHFGTPQQEIDLYPGGVFYSVLFTPELCDTPEAQPTCHAESAGLYDPKRSSTTYNISASTGSIIRNETFHGTQTLHGDAAFAFDSLTLSGGVGVEDIQVTNATILALSRGFRTYPGGKNYAAAVGNMALGAPDRGMVFGSAKGTMAASFLFENRKVPSYSFGMHIGSPTLGIPGSLYFGGYDQSRIVGPISSQQFDVKGRGLLPIDLVDISIGVADDSATSPFGFRSKTGLLARGNSSLSPNLSVEIQPVEPYLYLPDSTCRAIAAELPIIFNSDLGLYLWDTASPSYQKIIDSPTAYLGFTFRFNSSITKAFDIKVPFKLLNLMLTEPLMDRPTAYFPCSLPTLESLYSPPFRLGRAFLQAAFIGVNWEGQGKRFFLAQAPGPKFSPPVVRSIQPNDETAMASQDDWLKTWTGTGTGTSPDGNSADPTGAADASSGKVESGAGSNTALIAGAVGGGVVLLIIIGLVWWYLRRRSRNRVESPVTGVAGPPEYWQQWSQPQVVSKHERDTVGELSGSRSPRLLDSKQVPTWGRVPTSAQDPVEMPAWEVDSQYYSNRT